jgi:tetratricopeptide (TPR) repeat protein
MVLDNADDTETFFSTGTYTPIRESEQPAALFSYIPKSPKGFIIITTRDARVGERLADREKPIAVRPLAVEEAELLLRSKLTQDREWREADVAKLLDTLEYLPLAITQAAAFISENSITLADYIETLQASDLGITDLLTEDLHDPRRDRDALNSVIRTWKLSFDQIRKQKPRAAQLLSLMAVLDRHEIPKSLLSKEDEQGTEFITALGTLQAFSLIAAERGGEIFVMHRLVQLSIQNWLELQNTRKACQEETMEILSRMFPSGEYTDWKICEVLSPHAQAVLEYHYVSKSSMLHRATLLYNVAWYEREQGRYETAYRNVVEAYNAHRNLLGGSNPTTLNSLGLLALILDSQGCYGAAEEMFQQRLKLREKVLGKEHPTTLVSMNNLASVLNSQGKYEAAEEVHRQVLGLREKVLARGHPGTLTSMNNLASVLNGQGKYEAAEEMHRQVLGLSEKVLGTEHPDALMSMNNLASVLDCLGKYETAEEMHRRVLGLREKVFGQEHPNTLVSIINLAFVLKSQGNYEAADEMFQQVLKLRKKVLGKEHPKTLKSMNDLASVLDSQGKYEAAEEMLQQVLELSKKVLGKEHPNTLMSMNNLALVLDSQGNYEAAEKMQRRVLELREKVLGKEHPHTLVSMNNLESVLGSQGKYCEVEGRIGG